MRQKNRINQRPANLARQLLMLLLLLCSIAAYKTAQAEIDVPNYKAYVTATALNVRTGPGSSYRIIESIGHGKSVFVTHHEGSWRRISWVYDGIYDNHAYVHGDYLSTSNSASPKPFTDNDVNIPNYYATVTASALNVRYGPGTTYRIIDKLYQGNRVYVTHHNGVWRRLSLPGGVNAYVHGSYLRRNNETPDPNPGFPKLPDGCQDSDLPEVGAWLYEKMWRHVTGLDGSVIARMINQGNSLIISLPLFYNDIKTGAPFDLKNQKPLSEHSKCGVKLYGRAVAYDVPGNINFGFEGVKFLQSNYVSPPTTSWTLREFLLAGAGTAQAASDRDWEKLVSVYTGIPSAGFDFVHKLRALDNPCDADAINVGIDHAYNRDFETVVKKARLRNPRGACTN